MAKQTKEKRERERERVICTVDFFVRCRPVSPGKSGTTTAQTPIYRRLPFWPRWPLYWPPELGLWSSCFFQDTCNRSLLLLLPTPLWKKKTKNPGAYQSCPLQENWVKLTSSVNRKRIWQKSTERERKRESTNSPTPNLLQKVCKSIIKTTT